MRKWTAMKWRIVSGRVTKHSITIASWNQSPRPTALNTWTEFLSPKSSAREKDNHGYSTQPYRAVHHVLRLFRRTRNGAPYRALDYGNAYFRDVRFLRLPRYYFQHEAVRKTRLSEII